LEKLKQFGIIPKGTTVSGVVNMDAGFAGSKALIDKKEYDKISLSGNAVLNNIQYKSPAYPAGIGVSSAQLKFNPANITLENLNGNYLGTNFSGSGSLNHLVGYMFRNETLTGNMNIQADKVDLNKWMATGGSTTTATTNNTAAASQPFAIPATMDISCKTAVGQLVYDDVTYSNLSGTLQLQDEKATLQNIQADALDGKITVNGSYSTKVNKTKPDISLSYNIKDMDVQKVFNAFNTSKFLMPIGKWLGGKLNSQLSMIGNMDGNMMPLLNSLTGNGNMLLLEGVLEKFAPLEKIASTLQIDRLKSIAVKEIKNYIEFANGKVLVKPFKVHVKDIDMEIGGFHGFDQSLDYKVNMQLPRSLMGAKGNTLVDGLVAKANAKGLPVKVSDIVNLNIKVTGTITNPQIAVDLKEMAGNAVKELETQVKDFVKAKADSLKQKATDSLNVIKKQAEQKAEEKVKETMANAGIDTTNLHIKNATDTLKKRAKDSVKSKLKKLIFN
jgi:hypothetical protein